jgi:hypothetical protein
MPVRGRLLLGPNENVTGDNDGAFVVLVYINPRHELPKTTIR